MDEVTLRAYAKINLTLDLTGRRADGYHTLESVMQSVTLCDELTLRRTRGALAVRCDMAALPQGEANIAHRAACAYFAAAGLPVRGVDISIRKRIPAQAGLGGGSADAAAAIAGLARLFPVGLGHRSLLEIAADVGADVPFCLTGGTQLAAGIGERLFRLPAMPDCAVLIVKPAENISTAAAYAAFDAANQTFPGRTPACRAALAGGSAAELAQALGNAFADALAPPFVSALCARLRRAGALGTCMSGSGSAVFGLFSRYAAAAAFPAQAGETCLVCRPARAGWTVDDT